MNHICNSLSIDEMIIGLTEIIYPTLKTNVSESIKDMKKIYPYLPKKLEKDYISQFLIVSSEDKKTLEKIAIFGKNRESAIKSLNSIILGCKKCREKYIEFLKDDPDLDYETNDLNQLLKIDSRYLNIGSKLFQDS